MNDPDRWAGSLALVRATIDALESPIAVVDSEGKVLLVNESWESNPSIRVDNIRTATDRIISANNWDVDAEEAKPFAISLDRVLSGQHGECRLRAEASGSLREQTLIRARRLSVGQAAAIFVVESGAGPGSKNSTANKEIRPPVAFFQCDLKGEIVGWSASAEDIFGTSERGTVSCAGAKNACDTHWKPHRTASGTGISKRTTSSSARVFPKSSKKQHAGTMLARATPRCGNLESTPMTTTHANVYSNYTWKVTRLRSSPNTASEQNSESGNGWS